MCPFILEVSKKVSEIALKFFIYKTKPLPLLLRRSNYHEEIKTVSKQNVADIIVNSGQCKQTVTVALLVRLSFQ